LWEIPDQVRDDWAFCKRFFGQKIIVALRMTRLFVYLSTIINSPHPNLPHPGKEQYCHPELDSGSHSIARLAGDSGGVNAGKYVQTNCHSEDFSPKNLSLFNFEIDSSLSVLTMKSTPHPYPLLTGEGVFFEFLKYPIHLPTHKMKVIF